MIAIPSRTQSGSSMIRRAVGGFVALVGATALISACSSSGGGAAATSPPASPLTSASSAMSSDMSSGMSSEMSGGMSSDMSGGTTSSVGAAVAVKNFAFSPATLTVKVGTTVTWTFDDTTGHTVQDTAKTFTSKTLMSGQKFSHKFTKAGTYNYICTIHQYMKGTIIVK